jgi:Uncharacterized protein conserved in bacteria (DUF2188)
MDPIVVRRHADRWAVQDDPQTAPLEEYETRELAELAARDLARESGREVVVQDGPGEAGDGDDRAPTDQGERPSAGTNVGVPEDETPREPQAGM